MTIYNSICIVTIQILLYTRCSCHLYRYIHYCSGDFVIVQTLKPSYKL